MKKITLFLVSLVFAGALWAQNVQVSGLVSDTEGQVLPGVSVVVKGTRTSAITDVNGRYTISVPSDAVLEFSSMGMTTVEVNVDNRPTIDVTMESSALALDEVVVTGYGTGRKISSQVGSVVRVSAKTIENKPVANVADALQGRVAGLQVYSSSGEPSSIPSLRIHGSGSLDAGSTPLYVVDGTPISTQAIGTLNSNDFESVQVLKDAAATSIYGSRAANGVVYIVTKRGKAGEAAITVRGQYGISTLAQEFNVMNAKELLDLQLEYGVSGMTQEKYDEYIKSGVDTKWYQYFFKDNAPTYQGDVSISGGGDKMKYYVSAAYFSQDGLTPRSSFERSTVRSNLEANPKKWLKMGMNMAVAYAVQQVNGYTYNASGNGYSSTAMSHSFLPYVSPYDENGREKEYFSEMGMYNTLHLMLAQPSATNRLNLNGNTFVEIKPIEGLTVRSQFGLDLFDNRASSKGYVSYPYVVEASPFSGSGRAGESFSRWPTLTLTNTIEYKFDIADDHAFTVLAGHEGIKYDADAFGMSTSGQTDDRLLLMTNGPTRGNPTHEISQYAYLSFFGALNYSWQEKYFADFSVRNDASSRFGKDRRNATFFSVAGMWNLKKEDFLSSVDFVDVLTAKVSYGTTGNSDIGNYDHLAMIGTSRYNNQVSWGLSSAGNPELGWETQALFTAAVKAELLERFRIEVEFYNRRTLDMLMAVPMPYTSGWGSVRSNIGKMSNTGIDVTLGVDIYKDENWLIDFTATLNYNQNKITELFYGMDEWAMPDYLLGYKVGEPAQFYAATYAGVNSSNGKQLWQIPGTDQVTETYSADLAQMTGKPYTPPWSGGFELSANWNGLYASAFFSWVGEKYLVNNDRYFYENPSFFRDGDNQSPTIMNMWRKPGDVTDIPKIGEQVQFDTRQLENASFMRLKNLTIGYILPSSLLKKTNFFSAAKIYLTGRNLFTFTGYTGPDPEIDSNLTYFAYPNTRQYTVGLELTF